MQILDPFCCQDLLRHMRRISQLASFPSPLKRTYCLFWLSSFIHLPGINLESQAVNHLWIKEHFTDSVLTYLTTRRFVRVTWKNNSDFYSGEDKTGLLATWWECPQLRVPSIQAWTEKTYERSSSGQPRGLGDTRHETESPSAKAEWPMQDPLERSQQQNCESL